MAEKERLSYKERKAVAHEGHHEYFEGILQLRDAKQEQLDYIVDYIHENKIRISKHIDEKNGLDLYLTSQKFIQQLSRWIPQRFRCQLTQTRTLHTRDTKLNKDLYRVTLLVNFLEFTIGDVIEYEDEKVKIMSMGKQPTGKILSSGKRIFLDIHRIRSIEKNNE
jgi:NMD protein affecting ribosome stability and mRNA decay